MSVTEAEDRNAYETIAGLCILRDRDYPEETIAKKLGFTDAQDLHQQLRDWDLPDWIVGQVSAATAIKEKNRTKSRSRTRTLGPSRELPPPSNATALFRERLEALLGSLELLEHMDEDLRGKYFIRTDVDTTPVYFSRKAMSEEVWETISEQYDLDPDETGFLVTDARNKFPGGVAKSPSESLAILIGVYALAGGRMDLLVAALQRDLPPPESEVWDEIRLWVEGSKADNDKRDGLKVLAQHLAA